MAFQTGDSVKVKYTATLEGTIIEGATVDNQSNLLLKVEYVDQNGETQVRYFKAEELEAV